MKSYQAVYQILAKETDYISGEKIAEELSLTRTSIWKAIKRLEQEGIEIDSIKNKGYKLMNGDLILPEILEENLPIKVSFKPETRSTQLDAKEAIEKLLEYIEPHDLGEWPLQLQQLKAERPVTQAGEEGLTPQIVIDYINNH